MDGVEGGGQVLVVAGFPLSVPGFDKLIDVPSTFDVLPNAAGLFSFSPPRSRADTTVGAPSTNWKALSFVLVWVDGIMGGPVITCRGGATLLGWWGKAGFRGRHWPVKC